MAKYFNNIKKTGKLAGSVFSIRNGVTIERAYNPVVYNPSTAAQVAARAKLKLASQLAAVMAPVIAIPRDGMKTSRNIFVAKNYGALTYANDKADVDLAAIKLTDSVVALPPISVTRTGNSLEMSLQYPVVGINKVVYCAFVRQAGGELRYAGSSTASDPATAATLGVGTTAPVVVYAYGVRLNSDQAKAQFGNMNVPNVDVAPMLANLLVTRALSEYDITLTETQAMFVASPQQ